MLFSYRIAVGDSKKAGPREDEFPQGLPEQKGEDG